MKTAAHLPRVSTQWSLTHCAARSDGKQIEEYFMPINNSKELYIKMLSDVRQRTEHMTKIYQELSGVVQDPSIKETLESRVFLQDKILSSLDRWFKLIGEKPVALSGRLHDVYVRIFGASSPTSRLRRLRPSSSW